MLITFLLRCLRTQRREAVVLVSKIHVSKVRKSHQAIAIVSSLLSQCWKLEVSPSVNNIALASHGCFAGVKPTRLLLIQTKTIQENNSLHNTQYRSAPSVTAALMQINCCSELLQNLPQDYLQWVEKWYRKSWDCAMQREVLHVPAWKCGDVATGSMVSRKGGDGLDLVTFEVFSNLHHSVKLHPSSELVLWWTDIHQTQTNTAQLVTNHLPG